MLASTLNLLVVCFRGFWSVCLFFLLMVTIQAFSAGTLPFIFNVLLLRNSCLNFVKCWKYMLDGLEKPL